MDALQSLNRQNVKGGFFVRTNNDGPNSKQEGTWKAVFDDEARKINPLHDVNNHRNDLILESIQNDDWSEYNEFQAKQHPAWYEQVGGQFVPNKSYYGSLLSSKMKALKEAEISNNQAEIEKWTANVQEAINDFNHAPGVVPYVVGLNHTAQLANQYGVAQADDAYFDSKWNSPTVASDGKFKQNMWYDNAYIAENTELKSHLETLVAGTFPTSKDVNSNVNVATETVDQQPEKIEDENVEQTSIVETVNREVTTGNDEVSVQQVFLHNLKFGFSPSFKMVGELYK